MDSRVLHKIGYGVYIVTSKGSGGVNGQTANAVMQVTSQPPQIALGINKTNLTHDYIKESGEVAVSILAQDAPLNLIGRFGFKSGREVDKFDGADYRLCHNGCPVLLEHSVGYLEGKVGKEIDAGTHTVFIVEIVDSQSLREAEPMTYAYYHQVKRGTTPKTAPTYVEAKKPGKKEKFKCTVCGYIYDPELGDPERGVSPGTMFSDLPEDWVCPVCGAPKGEFNPVE